MGAPRKTPPPTKLLPDDGDEERPTVIPEFDPAAFARDSEVRVRAASSASSESTMDRARQHHSSGEHEQALFLVTGLLEISPLHPEASELAADCRAALERECIATFGSESSVFTITMHPEALKQLALDNVSGYLLSLVDGRTSVADILDIANLPRLLALRHVRDLVARGVLTSVSLKPT